MTVENNLSEIRAALATLSAIHAQGVMTRADLTTAANFVEERCDEIAALSAPAATVTLPILTLHDVVREGRAAPARQAAGRRHLQVVTNSGDAA